jgi:tRNA(fMet)-specific endonuclease VapC
VRERYRKAEASADYLALSSVVMFEPWYGVAKSSQVSENTERLRILLSGNLDLLDFDDEDAKTAGQVRAALEEREPDRRLRPADRWQALRRGLTVVTVNTTEFGPGSTACRGCDK